LSPIVLSNHSRS